MPPPLRFPKTPIQDVGSYGLALAGGDEHCFSGAMDEARRVFGDLPGLSFASHQADALERPRNNFPVLCC
jgi:hypothetical protein